MVFVIMRCFRQTARAVVVLLAGIVAIVTRNPERRESCHKPLDSIRDTNRSASLIPDPDMTMPHRDGRGTCPEQLVLQQYFVID
jgi:hypothetical protein